MEQLSQNFLKNAKLPEDINVGKLPKGPVKIMQFGEGNFLRAFVDWMINDINKKGIFDGSVVVVQPLERGMADMINKQDGLYTLYLRGIENGQVKVEKNIITAINECLNPYSQWNNVVEYATSEDLRFVISNTTEAGIEYVEEPYTPGACQNTYPAKLTALMYERFKKYNGCSKKGLVVIPCELIDRNGDNLKVAVKKYAALWKFGEEFEAWVENSCAFLNTLVDRIVPGFPRDELDKFTQEQGYTDNIVDTGEIFHFWVIEGDKKYSEELPLHKAGLNVLWTDNMEPYRTRKVRILNGAHTMTVLAAYLCGLDTVGECIADNDVNAFMRKGIFEEIIPTFSLPEEEKKMFAEAVLERFANPFIKHMLLSISLNSVSKFKVRVLPSLVGYYKAMGKLPVNTVFSLAALISFYKGLEIVDGAICGDRKGEAYQIKDKPSVLEFFCEQWKKYQKTGDSRAFMNAVLSNADFWDEDLTKIDGLEDAVTTYFNAIEKKGMRNALKELA